LILEPTKDLAQQTHTALQSFSKYLPTPKLNFVNLIGGGDEGEQRQFLSQGVDIVTGTPGKIEALLNEGILNLNSIRFLVLDEADQLVEQVRMEEERDRERKRERKKKINLIFCISVFSILLSLQNYIIQSVQKQNFKFW